jgi:hypothetical protein
MVAPAKLFGLRGSMALITLIAVGLLSDGFMLYVLLQWMRDDGAETGAKRPQFFQNVFPLIGTFPNPGRNTHRTPGKDRDCASTPRYIQNAGRNVRLEGRGRNFRAREVKGTTNGHGRTRRVHDLQPNHGKENCHPA